MSKGRRYLFLMLFYAALMIGVVSSARTAEAQGTAQVTIMGVPPVLSSPELADQVQKYRQGLYPIQFIYTSPNARAVPFTFRATLTFNGATLFDITSEPTSFRPGVYTYLSLNDPPAIRFRQTIDDLIAQLTGELRTRVETSGKLPEGSYRLTIKPVAQGAFISTLPGTAFFRVRYAQPPTLFTPADQSLVTQAYPVFSWTPVVGRPGSLIEYELLLVKVESHQTPLQAIQSNRAWAQVAVPQQTTFVYGPQQLPLEEGDTYAWQITARDLNELTPISDEGETRIFTFTYNPSGTTDQLAFAEHIWLVPGLARLELPGQPFGGGAGWMDNDALQVRNAGGAYVLNGRADLVFVFNENVRIPVNLLNLRLPATNQQSVVAVGGSVSGALAEAALRPGGGQSPVSIERIEWRYGERFHLTGRITLPDGRTIPAQGVMSGATTQFSAQMTASGSPLVAYGGDVAGLSIDTITAYLPSGSLVAEGDLSLFDGRGACRISRFDLTGADAGAVVYCETDAVLPLAPPSETVTYALSQIEGTLDIDFATSTLAYDLEAEGQVSLDLQEQLQCGAMVTLRLQDDAGISLAGSVPACEAVVPEINLGFVHLLAENVRLAELDYDEGGSWNYAFELDGQLAFPALNGLALPSIEGLRISPDGIDFPSMSLGSPQLAALPTVGIDGLSIGLTAFSMPAFTFPWNDWSATHEADDAGPWAFDMDLEISFDDSDSPYDDSEPSTLPPCLRDQTIAINDAGIRNGVFTATAPVTFLNDCSVSFGAGGYSLTIEEIRGELTSTFEPGAGFGLNAAIQAGGAVTLGEPYTCGTDEPLHLDGTPLTFDPLTGIVTGAIEPIIPPCSLALGPYPLTMTSSNMTLDADTVAGALVQGGRIRANAELVLADTLAVAGALSLDMRTGSFDELNFVIEETFLWGFPIADPVLSFEVNRASVGPDGMRIDGRYDLLLPGGKRIGATFDNLLAPLEQERIASGSITLDGAIAFEVGMQPDGSNLVYRAVPLESELSYNPGLMFALDGTITIDEVGLHADGAADAQLAVADWTTEGPLSAQFSEGFILGGEDFGIQSGRVELYYTGARIGHADETGFHLAPGFLASQIPDRIPLPLESVAYLQVKENGSPLVTFSEQPNGSLLVRTASGESVDLVIPALTRGGMAPKIVATFDSLLVDASYNYISGTVTATAPAPISLDPIGVPMQVSSVVYGESAMNGQPFTGLFIQGSPVLFGEPMPLQNDFVLAVRSNGSIMGSLSMDNVNGTVSVVDDIALLEIDQINGNINVPAVGTPNLDLRILGALVLQDGGSEMARAGLALNLREDGVTARHVASDQIQAEPIAMGPFRLRIDSLTSNSRFAYTKEHGFGFRIAAAFKLGIDLGDSDPLYLPFDGVEVYHNAITNQTGLLIPSQTVTEEEQEQDSDTTTVSVGPVTLRVFNAELTEDADIDLLNPLSSLAALDRLQLDIGISVAGFPAIADREFSVYDAGFNNGIITGTLEPYTFVPGQEPTLYLGGSATTGLLLESVSGSLTGDTTASSVDQGFAIGFTGEFMLPDFFASENPDACPPMDVALQLNTEGGLTGTVNNFAACGGMAFGPATLEFPSSTLRLHVNNDRQRAILDGQAVATVQGNNSMLTASGNLSLDLITGEILNGSIVVNGPFRYGLPANDPFFYFSINEARLEPGGFTITGSGSLVDSSQTITSVAFNDFKINAAGRIAGGSARLETAIGMKVALDDGVSWNVTSDLDQVPTNPALLLSLPANATLDADGLSIDGESSATLFFNGTPYASLGAVFQPLHFGLDPAGVDSGRVDLLLQDTRIAYYDANGFSFDAGGITAGLLPDTLGLPTKDVAYIVLKDQQDNPLVNWQEASGGESGYVISSITNNGNVQPVELVISALGESGSHPSVELTLDPGNPLVVDDAFQQVISGRIEIQIDENLSQQYGLPLRLTTLTYEKTQNGRYALSADGSVVMPPALGGEAIAFTNLGFSSEGITGLIEVGMATSGCRNVPNDLSNPLTSVAYAGGALQTSEADLAAADFSIQLNGLELSFNRSGNSYQVMGSVSSRLIRDGDGGAPDYIPFVAGYTDEGAWIADLCVDLLPTDDQGNPKLDMQIAEFSLRDNAGNQAGAGVSLIISEQETALELSGVVRLRDVFGGDVEVTVTDLRMGTNGISVGNTSLGGGGQSFTLFGGEVKINTTRFNVTINDQDDLVLAMDGNLWLTSFMDATNPDEAAQFQNLQISTAGDVTLGSGSADLLTQDLAIIGSGANAALLLNELRLEKPEGAQQVALSIGGEINIEAMEGVSQTFDFHLTPDGQVASEDPLNVRLVGAGCANMCDARKDNPDTEFPFGGAALLDVKEVGLEFAGGQLSQPAVYANGALYIQDGVDNLVRFGALGARGAENAGFYYAVGAEEPIFNPTSQIDSFDIGGFLTIIEPEATIETAANGGGTTIILGGTAKVTVPGATGEADWQGITISKEEFDIGDLGEGGLSVSLIGIADLTIGTLDYGSGAFTYTTPDANVADSTINAESYFKFTGAEFSIAEVGGGGVKAMYYYRTASGTEHIAMYGARLDLIEDVATAQLTFVYEDGENGMYMAANGYVAFGTEKLTLAGEFANADGQLRYGLFVSYENSVGVPIIPGIVTATGFGGGFFYRPTQETLNDIIDLALLESNKNHDGQKLLTERPSVTGQSGEELLFAAFLKMDAGIIGQGDASLIKATALLAVTNNYTSFYAIGDLFGQGFLKAGLNVNVLYGEVAGMDGSIVVDTYVPALLEGQVSIDFGAYDTADEVMWFVSGKIGDGSGGAFTVASMFQASGEFLACNDGFLLNELTVEMNVDIAILAINAGATMSFWWIPDVALGAYAKVYVNASLLGGLAEIGANLRGAYLDNEDLIYLAAEAYVEVAFVFEGRMGIWASIHDGDLNGGTGSNGRYDQMVADAKEHAEAMLTKAKAAAQAMEAAMMARFAPSGEDIRRAGMNLLLPYPDSPIREFDYAGRPGAVRMYGNLMVEEVNLYVEDESRYAWYRPQDYPDALEYGELWVKEAPEASNDMFYAMQQKITEANERITAVGPHLNSITTTIIEWNDAAAELLAEMNLQSPIGAVSGASFSGGRMTANPSFNFDDAVAAQQESDLSELKASIEVLDAQYFEAITAVESNLAAANSLFETGIVYDTRQVRVPSTPEPSQEQEEFIGVSDPYGISDAIDNSRFGGNNTSSNTGQSGQWEYTTVEVKTSINGLAGIYADAEAATRAFYSERADYLWGLSGWASRLQDRFHEREVEISAAVEHSADQIDEASREEAEDLLVQRRNIFYELLPDKTKPGGFAGTIEELDAAAFESEFISWGNRIWYEVFDSGLQGIKESVAARVSNVADSLSANVGSSSYAQFTEQIDGAYLAKNQLITTLYGMIDTYQAWRENAGLAGAPLPGLGSPRAIKNKDVPVNSKKRVRSRTGPSLLEMKLTHLENVLAPPQINGISVTRNSDRRTAQATITIDANHPINVAETSYSIERGDNSSVYGAGTYYSVGSRDQVDIFTFAETQDQETQDFSVAIRARGPGGATISRVATFTLAVNAGGVNVAPDGSVPGTATDDNTPPEYLYVNLRTVRSHNGTLWTASPDQLALSVSAFDGESDIAGFDFKIGLAQGGDEVTDWSPILGTKTLTPYIDGVYRNAMVEATLRGLNLEAGEEYYLTVAARNGAGMRSVKEYSEPLAYDSSPPTWQQPQQAAGFRRHIFRDRSGDADEQSQQTAGVTMQVGQLTGIQAVNISESVNGAMIEAFVDHERQAPDLGALPPPRSGWESGSIVERMPTYDEPTIEVGDALIPRITVYWEQAFDLQSGVAEYEYVALNEELENPAKAFADETKVNATEELYAEITRQPLSYVNPTWVYVRARNGVEQYSDVIVLGPYTPNDPTRPTSPDIAVRVRSNGLEFYFTTLSYDLESGIKGYQYSVFTWSSRNVIHTIRPWPSDGSIDMKPRSSCPTNYDMAARAEWLYRFGDSHWKPNVLPTGCLPVTDAVHAPDAYLPGLGNLPEGEPLYIAVRAVNGQGQLMRAKWVHAAPVYLDYTVPRFYLSSTMTAGGMEAVADSFTTTITVSSLDDPESGIRSVEYCIRYDSDQGACNQPFEWIEWTSYSDPFAAQESLEMTRYDLRPFAAEVGIRVTNGAGLQSVRWETPHEAPRRNTGFTLTSSSSN